MGKRIVSVFMTAMLLYGLVESLFAGGAVSAADLRAISAAAGGGSPTRNVALNAKVTASGQCNSSESAKFAVDGKTDTKWCDNSAAKIKWMKLDLGKPYTINEWVVLNAGINETNSSPFWNTKNFRLQKSADGVTWMDVDVVQNNAQTIVDRYLPEPFTAQYVRFYVSQGAYDSNTVRLYELELYGVDAGQTPAYPPVNLDPVDYVDPFINTLGDNGQTNPGPTMPFGLVSLGPDSDGGAFSGYYYQDKNLKGFSHLRFSGVGCSGAGGSILMMPETRDFTNNSNEYKQPYDKSSEQASAGYYAVTLNSGVGVELTASDNVGFHRYTFPENASTTSVLVDLSNNYNGAPLDTSLTVENNREISGMVKAQNVCGNGYYVMYYSIQFDHDFNSYTSWQGDATGTVATRTGPKTGVWVNFENAAGQAVQAKVGLSPISVEQAKYERDHDIAGWDFDAQHAKIRGAWSDLLGKVEVTDADEENKKIFYTQLYHTFLHPKNVTSSVGTFKAGRDENTIRQALELGNDFEYYNGWTTWDDFRKYALFSVLTPKEYNNMVKSLADLYKTRGTYTQWGSGYWPSPTVRNEFNGAVVLDAYAKGFKDFDVYTALQGMGVDADNFGDQDKVSGQLEKARSGYFPMKLAELVGDKATYERYKQVALSYQNLWNPKQADEKGRKIGFFTPNGMDVSGADVTAVDRYAYQGNLWQYRWSAMQDMEGLAELMGGKTEMAKQLLDFFERDEYMAINETDLDAPYLFNYLGYPYLTQYYAREFTTEVVTQKYHNHGAYSYPLKSRVYRADPEGYLPSMDDDAGAMASWFVYSALGLFPANPGDAAFLIGSPIFSEVKLHLDGGKTLTIKANNVSSQNRFIQSAQLNGKKFDQAWISYEAIMAGGTLEFDMGSQPNMAWGAMAKSAPPMTDFGAGVDDALSRQELIALGSEWKYFDKGQPPGGSWQGAGFDDSAWNTGAAPLGYDNKGYAKTVVSYGPDGNNKYPTTYFRKTFEVSNKKDMLELDAKLVRDDGAIVYLNGQEIFRTNMPAGPVSYNTYANATVGDERDRVSFRIDPSLLVAGTNVLTAEVHQVNATSSDIAFDFGLEAVMRMTVPPAPTVPVVDDKANTFGWTFVPGFESATDYEFTTDGGKNWSAASANPQIVGPGAYETGQVQVRVKSDASLGRAPGERLVSKQTYTSDIVWDVFDLKADVNRKGNMVVSIDGNLKGTYVDEAVAVIQLMNGSGQAMLSSAVPVETGAFDLSQTFNVNSSRYQVNIYLVDDYNGNIYESVWLAEPIISQAEPAPEPPEQPGDDGLPEPIPVPVKTPDVPEPAVEPEPPAVDPKTIEFESYTAMSPDVNTFNNKPLGTEDGNNGIVVKNTFNGAWLSYKDVDFGTEGANRVTVEYTAPSDKAPTDAALEFRLDGTTGELVGAVTLLDTGNGWDNYATVTTAFTKTVTGKHDLYVVMKGSTTSSRPYIGNFDRFTWGYQKTRNDFAPLELEKFDAWSTDPHPVKGTPLKVEGASGGINSQQVANTFNGAWLAYKGMDFGVVGVNQISITYAGNTGNTAADAKVEIRLGGVNGALVGTVETPPTGNGWGTYKTVTADLNQTITGVQDLYFVLKGTIDGTYSYIGNFEKAAFSMKPQTPNFEPVDGKLSIDFEARTEWTSALNTFNQGGLGTEPGNGGTVVKNTFDGAWLLYRNVNFGTAGMNRIEIVYDAPANRVPAGARAEIRLGEADGTLVGTVALPNTASSGWGTYRTAAVNLDTTVTGLQNVYIVLKGATTSSLLYIGNFDKFAFSKTRSDYGKLELETFDAWSTANNPAKGTPLKTETSNGRTQVANTFQGAWLAYKGLDFGSDGVNQLSIEYSGNSNSCPPDAAIEVRLGGGDGTLVGTIPVPPTAASWTTYRIASGDLNQNLTGVQDVYFVLTGTSDVKYIYIGNFDNASFTKK
ncbi:glycoside hydrolase domain-containing protein [Paenibacillus phocaensis]|uniref:glycoside hydrolase domain-containing protein n=1 Tax=Paenibacillus phocaensis TaxID=1776378 RepID=UPI000839B5C2|nr:glycoside hydrolase domain-containing protein [Paenibacillus phocaensis]